MRDIIPPKQSKKRASFKEPEKIEQVQDDSFKILHTERPKGRGFKILLILFIFIVLSGAGAYGYYFLYMKQDEATTEDTSETKQGEQKDLKTQEIEQSLNGMDESVENIDEEETDLESPTLDLNIEI